MEAYIVVFCPHCNNVIQIYRNEINCAIFRHGVFKQTGIQMNPHLPKIVCDILISRDLIFGCGKPFKLTKDNENYKAEICDYI